MQINNSCCYLSNFLIKNIYELLAFFGQFSYISLYILNRSAHEAQLCYNRLYNGIL